MARERIDELAFFNAPDKWPLWPILPVKSRTAGFGDKKFIAIVHASTPTRVYFTNLFALGKTLVGIEYKDYPNLDALLTGYMID